MASRVAFVLVLVLLATGHRVPGRCELSNPDVEVAAFAKRPAAKRAPLLPA